jgi:hypothetical protein
VELISSELSQEEKCFSDTLLKWEHELLDLPVSMEIMTLEEARAAGAIRGGAEDTGGAGISRAYEPVREA